MKLLKILVLFSCLALYHCQGDDGVKGVYRTSTGFLLVLWLPLHFVTRVKPLSEIISSKIFQKINAFFGFQFFLVILFAESRKKMELIFWASPEIKSEFPFPVLKNEPQK